MNNEYMELLESIEISEATYNTLLRLFNNSKTIMDRMFYKERLNNQIKFIKKLKEEL